MKFKYYKQELDLIERQNPIECELYSIIASLLRELYADRNVSIRDVSNCSKKAGDLSIIFMSDKGPPDMVILSKEYSWSNVDKKHRLGAIEIKYMHKGFPRNGKAMNQQIKSQIFEFKNLLFTTGLKWRYYEYIDNQICIKWTVELGNYDDKTRTIIWNDEETWDRLIENLLDKRTFN